MLYGHVFGMNLPQLQSALLVVNAQVMSILQLQIAKNLLAAHGLLVVLLALK